MPECAHCGGALRVVREDELAERGLPGAGPERVLVVGVEHVRCERCRAGGEIVRREAAGTEVTRRGPAVSASAAAALKRALARDGLATDPPADVNRRPLVADGGQVARTEAAATILTYRLQKVVAQLATATENCLLRFDADGLRASATDVANVQFVDVDLPAELFETYDADGVEIRTAVRSLKRLLAFAEDGGADAIDLATSDDGLVVEWATSRHVIPAPETAPDGHDPAAIRDVADAAATVHGSGLARFLAGLPEDCNYVEVLAEPHGPTLTVRAEYGDESHEKRFHDGATGTLEAPAIEESVAALYSVDHLRPIAEAIRASPPVRVHVADEGPLLLEYPVVGGWDDPGEGRISVGLAPRIRDTGEEEEDD